MNLSSFFLVPCANWNRFEVGKWIETFENGRYEDVVARNIDGEGLYGLIMEKVGDISPNYLLSLSEKRFELFNLFNARSKTKFLIFSLTTV